MEDEPYKDSFQHDREVAIGISTVAMMCCLMLSNGMQGRDILDHKILKSKDAQTIFRGYFRTHMKEGPLRNPVQEKMRDAVIAMLAEMDRRFPE